MSVLPHNDKERKNLPIFKLICNYFPKALREVTRVAVANNVRYNPDRKPADINWARGKSTDQMGSLFRHMLESQVDGLVFEALPPEVQAACGPGFERVYVLAEAAWRALAALELQIEEQECKVPFSPLDMNLGYIPPSQKVWYCSQGHAQCYEHAPVPVGTTAVDRAIRGDVDCVLTPVDTPAIRQGCQCGVCNTCDPAY